MNYKMTGSIISKIILVEAAFMSPAVLFSVADKEKYAVIGFLLTYLIMMPAFLILSFITKNPGKSFSAREGLVCVAISWFVISLFGAFPFYFSGEIKGFTNALFETVSGFTTTGATILTDVESLSRGLLYWRSFTHWLGGMGVLVFVLALIPAPVRNSGFTVHILRAESPGPSVSKLVPRIKDTAKILYMIYVGITVLNILFLIFGGMPFFDALCTAFGTAGTGGFGVKNDSLAGYSPYLQVVTTVFMLMFGINFTCYYLILMKQGKSVLHNEELRFYLCVFALSSLIITLNIRSMYPSLGETIRHASFQVSSIMTTTGYSTTDFDLWPSLSKSIIIMLMIVGACAGSTGGGLKCGRVLLLFKGLKRNIKKTILPKKIEVVSVDKRPVDENILDNTNAYLAAYVIIVILSVITVSLDNFSFETNFTAVLSCFNNIGPGLSKVGPSCNFSEYSVLSKFVLIFDMLAGRLEIFPILAVFSKSSWTRR